MFLVCCYIIYKIKYKLYLIIDGEDLNEGRGDVIEKKRNVYK